MQELRPTWCRGVLSWAALGECCLDAFLFLLGKQLKKSGEKPLLGGSLMEYAILSAIAAMNEPKTCSTTALKKYVLENHPGTNSNYQSKTQSCTRSVGTRGRWGSYLVEISLEIMLVNERALTTDRKPRGNNLTNLLFTKDKSNQDSPLIYSICWGLEFDFTLL